MSNAADVEAFVPVPIRRVVTGHDANEVAHVLWDERIATFKRGKSGFLAHLWNTHSTPADIGVGDAIEDPGSETHVTPPPPGGTRFVIIDYPPGNSGTMHRTETLDYVIVLSGAIEMEMDDSTVRLQAGDTLIQRGTNHAWYNRGSENARVAFVLVDAEPLAIGHPRTSD